MAEAKSMDDLSIYHPYHPRNPYGGQFLPRILPSHIPSPSLISPESLIENRPTSPCLWFGRDDQILSLPIIDLQLMAHFYVSTAVCKLSIVFQNSFTDQKTLPDALFCLPIKGTVTAATVKIGEFPVAGEGGAGVAIKKESKEGMRQFETTVIPKDELEKLKRNTSLKSTVPLAFSSSPMEQFVPDLFRLPLSDIKANQKILVEIDYLETLPYWNGHYHFRFPLKFPKGILPLNRRPAEILRLYASVYAVLPSLTVASASHPFSLIKNDGRFDITAGEIPQEKLNEFHVAYSLASNEVVGTCIKEPDAEFVNANANNANGDIIPVPAPLLAAQHSASVSHAPASERAPLNGVRRQQLSSASDGFDSIAGRKEGEMIEGKQKYNENDMDEALVKPNANAEGEKGSFVFFVTPPTPESIRACFSRHIVFLLDRSGSMTGGPFDEAVAGLEIALLSLTPADRFTVVAFDHDMILWHTSLYSATPEHKAHAVKWCRAMPPQRGGTDIRTPLAWAVNMLRGAQEGERKENQSSPLPFVFLLTDGCVKDEREICSYIQRMHSPVRLLTFGIGTYANWYFLKMLAEIGRGYNENVVYKEQIRDKVAALISMAAQPVLTNITIAMEGVEQCDLYPYPIPDLFAGAPLMIAGRYSCKGGTVFPRKITLRGQINDGRHVALDVNVSLNPLVPVQKVLLKQRIDLLTARCWLTESKDLEREIVALSVRESMPSAYTAMVAYEVSQKELEKRKKDGGGSLTTKRKPVSPNMIAGIAVGGAIVIGAAVVVFGDLASTIGNLPVGEIFSSLGDVACGCDCCACLASPCDLLCGFCGCICSQIGSCIKCFC